MKNTKEIWAAIIILAAITLLALLSVGKAIGGGYAYNLFADGFHSSEVSWSIAIGKRAKLRNTIEIPQQQAKSLTLLYSRKNINVYPSETDRIIVKEYLFDDKEKNLAEVTYEGEDAAVITGGDYLGRGTFHIFFFSFGNQGEHIDVYVPDEGMKELCLETGSGNITMDSSLRCACDLMNVEASSGNVKLENVEAEEISVHTKSGNMRMETIEGKLTASAGSGNLNAEEIVGEVELAASSGNITVEDFEGCGSMKASSGNVRAKMLEVTGDIAMEASSGNVSLDMPTGIAFTFQADTSSGNIRTDFDEKLSYNKKGNSANGEVGANPAYRILMKATSGNVKAVYR